jgi:DNA polymerase-1
VSLLINSQVLDTETNALKNYTKVHVLVFRDCATGEVSKVFRKRTKDSDNKDIQGYINTIDVLCGHNIIGFDFGVLDYLNVKVPSRVVDTLVVGRMLNFSKDGGHSLEAYGDIFGIDKSSFSDFSEWSQELEDRCITDTEINYKLFKKFEKHIFSERWREALDNEHYAAYICNTIGNKGITFDYTLGLNLKKEINLKLDTLRDTFKEIFKPKSKLLRVINPSVTSKGSIALKDFRWLEDKDLRAYSPEEPFSLFTYEEFNPNSPSQIVARLNEAGWKPTDKTKGHILAEKSKDKAALEKFKVTGWKINEENLATLPKDAPEGARKLAEWLLISSRASDLSEWLNAYNPSTGRIHGNFTSIGGWSQRVSHSNPNMANIPAVKNRKGEPALYGWEFRSLWLAAQGRKLLGVDAEGIQLRLFAHLCEDYRLIEAVQNGNKEEGTDIHTLNKLVLGPICRSREVSKTYIYAMLLGAGDRKRAEILDATRKEADEAYNRLLSYYPGIAKLQNGRLAREGARGYITCIDGRYLPLPEARLALTGHLQSGEKIIMTKAMRIWEKELSNLKDKFDLVNWVHDEWQTEVEDDEKIIKTVAEAQMDGIVQAGEAYNLNIQLAGSYKVGRNWAETH